MYVGRLLVVGPGVGAYRVSSRSFPNREIEQRDGRLAVVPTPEAEATDNPYVSYDCLQVVEGDAGDGPRVAVGNGTHVGAVAGKLELGYPARDALATALFATDFERDAYDTPRVAGVVTREGAAVGVVRRDALLVRRVEEPTLVATYERDAPAAFAFEATDAPTAAREAYDLDFEHPVCAAGVTVGSGVETAFVNG